MKKHPRQHSRSIYAPLIISFVGVGALVAVLETLKQIGHPDISLWESHTITIFFSASAATAITLVILMKNRVSMLIYRVSNDAIMVTDKDNRILDVNPAFTRITGYTLADVKGKEPDVMKSDRQDAEFFRVMWRELSTNDLWSGELWNRRKNGELYAVAANIYVIRHPSGKIFRYVAELSDITERKASEEALKESEARARALSQSLNSTFNELYSIVEANPDLLYLINADGELVRCNTNFENVCGLDREQMLNRPVTDFVHKEDRPAILERISDVLKNGYATFEVRFMRYDGVAVPYWCNGIVLKGPEGKVIGVTGTGRDVTERKVNEEKMLHSATHDTLTGMPNRELFSDHLHLALATDKREKSRLAVMFIDADKFKPINDSFGHDVGDLVLKETARRIQHCLRESDTAARIGGDEFLVLLPSIDDASDALKVAEKIRETLDQAFEVSGHVVHTPVSIGIAIYPDDGVEESLLITYADTAMYFAKQSGGNTARLFSSIGDSLRTMR